MATYYVMLMSLTPEGRRDMLDNPDSFLKAADSINVPGAQLTGTYATLGQYDFVGVLLASDNDQAARFSMELGVVAGVHTTTMPAIPLGTFGESLGRDDPLKQTAGSSMPDPADYESSPS